MHGLGDKVKTLKQNKTGNVWRCSEAHLSERGQSLEARVWLVDSRRQEIGGVK